MALCHCSDSAHEQLRPPFILFILMMDTLSSDVNTLSLHDALPISAAPSSRPPPTRRPARVRSATAIRSEEHTSELQSRGHLVCRLLLEKKNFIRMMDNLFYFVMDLHSQFPSRGCTDKLSIAFSFIS